MPRNFSNMPGDIGRIQAQFKSTALGRLARIVKNEALNHFEESWDNQGFTDYSITKWRERKKPDRQINISGARSKTATRWEQKNAGRAILVGHQNDTNGIHLKDSLVGEWRGNRVIIRTNKAYAQVHNEGGRSGRGKGFIMPIREFMGPSIRLNEKVKRKFNHEMDNLFKKL